MCQNTLPPETFASARGAFGASAALSPGLNPLWNWLAEILPAVTDQHESWEITLTGRKNTIDTTIRIEISEREHPNAVTRTTTICRPILIRPRAANMSRQGRVRPEVSPRGEPAPVQERLIAATERLTVK